MSIKSINLPKSECFPCGKRDVKHSLEGLDPVEIEFRHNILKTYRYAHLSFDGHVLANLGITRQFNSAHLYIFPIQKEQYPESAMDEFTKTILPQLRSWFEVEFNKSETAIFASQEELFVVWSNGIHKLQRAKFNN